MTKLTAALRLVSDNSRKRPMLIPQRRDLDFKLDPAKISEWHYSGGPIFTSFLNTFSIVLPVGERFFINSVRTYRDQIADPELLQAVKAFIGQEAMHGREHEAYNEALFSIAPIAPKFERFVDGLLKGLSKRSKVLSLSGTIALEHFTGLLADSVLAEPRLTEGVDPNYKALWQWHALEETEHKAVAFDVWDAVMGRGPAAYAARMSGFALATVLFWGLVIPVFIEVLRTEGKLKDWEGWQRFFRFTFGDIGMLRRQLGNYLDYVRPGFHPWDHDNREYLKQIDAFLEEQEKLTAA